MDNIPNADREKYKQIFQSLAPTNGFVSGDKIRDVFIQSGLPTEKLSEIWEICDVTNDGRMDILEFSSALHMIFLLLNNKSEKTLINNGPLLQNNKTFQFPQQNRDTGYPWRILDKDLNIYESIFYKYKALFGEFVEIHSLRKIFEAQRVSDIAIAKAWQLIDPEMKGKLNKQQTIHLLHVINLHNNKVELPISIPKTIKDALENNYFPKNKTDDLIHTNKQHLSSEINPYSRLKATEYKNTDETRAKESELENLEASVLEFENLNKNLTEVVQLKNFLESKSNNSSELPKEIITAYKRYLENINKLREFLKRLEKEAVECESYQ